MWIFPYSSLGGISTCQPLRIFPVFIAWRHIHLSTICESFPYSSFGRISTCQPFVNLSHIHHLEADPLVNHHGGHSLIFYNTIINILHGNARPMSMGLGGGRFPPCWPRPAPLGGWKLHPRIAWKMENLCGAGWRVRVGWIKTGLDEETKNT